MQAAGVPEGVSVQSARSTWSRGRRTSPVWRLDSLSQIFPLMLMTPPWTPLLPSLGLSSLSALQASSLWKALHRGSYNP